MAPQKRRKNSNWKLKNCSASWTLPWFTFYFITPPIELSIFLVWFGSVFIPIYIYFLGKHTSQAEVLVYSHTCIWYMHAYLHSFSSSIFLFSNSIAISFCSFLFSSPISHHHSLALSESFPLLCFHLADPYLFFFYYSWPGGWGRRSEVD